MLLGSKISNSRDPSDPMAHIHFGLRDDQRLMMLLDSERSNGGDRSRSTIHI
jgi:hypothetical protein